MTLASLILLERTGAWAVALRRVLGATPVQVIETRSLAECWQQLAMAPTATLVWELTTDNLGALVGGLLRLNRDFPGAAAVVVADRRLSVAGGLVREAGAVHFVSSPRALEPVADIVRRRVAAQAKSPLAAAPSIAGWGNLLNEITAGLPWSDSSVI